MPYKDPEKKIENMRRWRKEKMAKGYGKWLYERRKLRFQAAENFGEVLERIIEVAEHGRMTNEARLSDIAGRARAALDKASEAEEALGRFKESE